MSAALSASVRLGDGSKTAPERVRDGQLRPAGDIGREPGGDNVDAYKDAAEGFDLRYVRFDSDCDRGRESMAGVECRVLGSFITTARA